MAYFAFLRISLSGSFCAIVVNAGTALTVDALTNEGVFVGGTITPGAQLMRDALATRTAALKLQAGTFSYFPDCTGDAITST